MSSGPGTVRTGTSVGVGAVVWVGVIVEASLAWMVGPVEASGAPVGVAEHAAVPYRTARTSDAMGRCVGRPLPQLTSLLPDRSVPQTRGRGRFQERLRPLPVPSRLAT